MLESSSKSHKLIVTGLLVTIFVVFIVRTVIPASNELTHGFSAYYTAAHVVNLGERGGRIYDRIWFADQVSAITSGRARDIYLATPPASAVMWLPLATLPIEIARIVWVWLNGVFLGIVLWLIATELRIATLNFKLVGLAALFTLSAATHEQFAFGQMYVFLLLLHVVGWRAFVRTQDRLAGIVLGLAFALKYSGWPLILLFIILRRWRALRWTVATVIATVVISLPFVGIDAWYQSVFIEVPTVMNAPQSAVTAYQTTTGFWQHALRFDAEFNAGAIANLPWLATLMTLAIVGAASLALIKFPVSDTVAFVAAVALIELLSPAAEQFHYVLLLLPLSVLWHQGIVQRSGGLWIAAALATYLISWPIAYKDPSAAMGWNMLLRYPRLYGGWLVFIALMLKGEKRAQA